MDKKSFGSIATGLTTDEVVRKFPMKRTVSQGAETRCLSFFCMSGDYLNPSLCTYLLGVPPTDSHEKGYIQARSGIPAPTGEWFIEHDWHPCKSLQLEVEDFLCTLYPLKVAIAKCVSRQRLSVSFCIAFEVFDKDYPCLALPVQAIGCLADMGVEFSIDWYDFSEYGIGPDEKETIANVTATCITERSANHRFYMVDNLPNVSLEEIIGRVICWLNKQNCYRMEIRETSVVVLMEIHNGETPLLVLPPSLLKGMRDHRISLRIEWCRVS